MFTFLNRSRALIIVLAVLLGSAGGWVAASAGGNDQANPGGPSAAPTAPGLAAIKAALPGGFSETYTGIKPCRLLDTRASTPLADGARSFKVSGTLSGQGGLNNCGIPTNATSIAINLTGISTGSTGFIRGWAYNDSPATATLLNFGPDINASNQVNIPLCRGGGCSNAFTLRAWGSVNIVGDAVGYFTAPMYAAVSPTGAIYNDTSSGVVSATRVSSGIYKVTFDRDVSKCSTTASDILFATNNDVSPDNSIAHTTGVVQVEVVNQANALTDTFFFITVTC